MMQRNVLSTIFCHSFALQSRLVQTSILTRLCSSQTNSDRLVQSESIFEGQVKRLTLNDSKKRNALSLKMIKQLANELKQCSFDEKIRAIILCAVPPIFSGGHDLKELTTETGLSYHAKVFAECTKMMNMIQDIQIPVIAGVKGHAAAAGCQLAASCDIVVAAENSKFSTPGISVGLFCSTPGVAVVRNAPTKVAFDMLLTGEPIDAIAALRAGLVSRVVAEDKVDSECEKIAYRICSLSRPVVALGKQFTHAQIGLDRLNAYRQAEKIMIENLRLADCQEGIKSFVEKRPPKWSHTTKKVH